MFTNRYKMNSQALSQEIEFQVVAPKMINKVLILLHGYWDDKLAKIKHYLNPLTEISGNMDLQELADKYNMLIVTPYLYNWFYIDKPGRDVSRFLCEELRDELDGLFDMKDFDYFLAGISMGGYGSLLVGLNHPECFKGIGSISGAFISSDIEIANPKVVGNTDEKERRQYYIDTFGPLDDYETSKERNPEAVIKELNSESKLPPIILTTGTYDFMHARNIRVKELLEKQGVELVFKEYQDMGHEYSCFSRGLNDILENWFD